MDVGKYPLLETLSYVDKKREVQLEGAINKEDIFRAYFYLRRSLPENTLLETDFIQIYAYDDHFSLLVSGQGYAREKNAQYKMGSDCNEEWKIMNNFGQVKICRRI
jgi:hypothetical protein